MRLSTRGGLAYPSRRNTGPFMLLKIIALLSAAIPMVLLVRALMGRRPTKFGAAWREAKQQIDLGIYIFLGIIGCIVAFAAGKFAWAWWTSM